MGVSGRHRGGSGRGDDRPGGIDPGILRRREILPHRAGQQQRVSAIFGIVDFSGGSIDRCRFEAMRAAIAYFGPHAGGDWHGAAAAMGQCLLASTPEAIADPDPTLFSDCPVVAAGRLDNREDLVRALRLSPAVSDTSIAAQAWRRWGDEAPRRLLGDWSFAAWDPAARRLLLARDHMGNTSLYYHWDGRRLTFASSRKALFAWPHVPRQINELRLAQHLATWITDGAATLHDGIYRLPPGHVLAATANGIAITQYWHPERLDRVTLPRDEDYVERFLELYDAAVRTRMRGDGPIATTLSAGLDSGSVTALAAREARRKGQRLVAFTARPRFATPAPSRFLRDEWPLAQETARYASLDEHRPIYAEAVTPLEAMRRSLAAHDEPEYAAANLDWIHDLLGASRDCGARTLLTGQLGNGGVSWAGDRQVVARLFLQGRFIRATAALGRAATVTKVSLVRAGWRHLVSPLFQTSVAAARRRHLLRTPSPGKGLINPAFAARLRIGARMRESDDGAFSPLLAPLDHRLRIILPSINPIGALWHESGAAYGLDVRDPTVDVRLLEFCLSIPDEQFRLGGEERSLIKRAMAGLMPPSVLQNPRPGRQSADFAMRLRADAAAVDTAVVDICASPAAREYLDVAALAERWRQVRADAESVRPVDSHMLGRGLLFGLFLAGDGAAGAHAQ